MQFLSRDLMYRENVGHTLRSAGTLSPHTSPHCDFSRRISRKPLNGLPALCVEIGSFVSVALEGEDEEAVARVDAVLLVQGRPEANWVVKLTWFRDTGRRDPVLGVAVLEPLEEKA